MEVGAELKSPNTSSSSPCVALAGGLDGTPCTLCWGCVCVGFCVAAYEEAAPRSTNLEG